MGAFMSAAGGFDLRELRERGVEEVEWLSCLPGDVFGGLHTLLCAGKTM